MADGGWRMADGGWRMADGGILSLSAFCPPPSAFSPSPHPTPPTVTVLGIDTATDVCAVALVRGGALLAEARVAVPRSHATRLALLVQEALAHARLEAADLDAIAVSAGPGSYTGLRIGASLARGLALATGARIVGVGTMEALAAEAEALVRPGEALAVALPSRRGEVYLSTNGSEPEAVALADVAERLVGPVAVAGPAAAAVVAALGRGRVLDVLPSAARVARMGADRLADGAASADAFAPAYVGVFATPPRAV